MKRRFSALAAVVCAVVLFGGHAPVSAGGVERILMDIDTGATVDFGDGRVDYRAVDTIPVMIHQDTNSLMMRWAMDGVRYNKVDGGAPGPAYFDVITGSFTATGHGDPGDPTKGLGNGMWQFHIVTDEGAEYRTNGVIVDFNRTPDQREVWRWNGPVIEP